MANWIIELLIVSNFTQHIARDRIVLMSGTRCYKRVLEIREKLNKGYIEKDLAIEYNVSRPTITRIKNNKIWKNA